MKRKFYFSMDEIEECRKAVFEAATIVRDDKYTEADFDDFMTYYRISNMIHKGLEQKAIADSIGLSQGTVSVRLKWGSRTTYNIIAGIMDKQKCSIYDVHEHLAKILHQPEYDCKQFVKNFIVDWKHHSRSSIEINTLLRNAIKSV